MAMFVLLPLVLSSCLTNKGEPYHQGFCLDQSIESKILAPRNVQRIEHVQALVSIPANPPYGHAQSDVFFDILRVDLSLKGEFGREGMWHGSLVIRKKHQEQNWSNCEIFYAVDETSPAALSCMTSTEMAKHLDPYSK